MMLALAAPALVAGLFDTESVNTIELYFDRPDWDEALDSLYAEGEEGRLAGAVVVNGTRFDSVGVRYKGRSSYNPSRNKNPFNIKLDWVRAGQEVEGHGTLRLANVYKDPSFVREALSYEIARRCMPASRTGFANISVNDTLIGLYTNVEDVDRLFMRRHFLCDDNARFKGQMTDSATDIGWKYLGPDSSPYLDYFILESDSGWPELIGFLDTLGNFNAALDEVLDVDRHLWMLAFDILMVNLDAPINMAQNFYLYRGASGRFQPIVWDLNENFGAFRDLLGTGQLSTTQMQQLDPFLRDDDPDYPIASGVFPDARRRRMYVAHMRTLIDEAFADNWYRERAYEIQDAIDADVRADPNKFYTYNDFLNNVTRSVGSGPLAIVGLTELMSARVDWLLGQPDFAATSPDIVEVTAAPDRPTPGSDVTFTARVEEADSVFLGWRQISATRFRRTPMSDTAGLYSATVRIEAGDIEYYVYAENDSSGTFLPAFAEYDHFVLPVAGDVVINELLAINQTTIPDPAGEFDDYVELRNNSDIAVSLDGWLLSDDSLDPARWVFPDVDVPANGYLLVWADGDSGQPGLHAGFRLSGDGDLVLLSDDDGVPVDRAVFGPQSPDVAFGRWPDGSGPFTLMNPTPGAANDSGTGIAEPSVFRQLCRLEHARPNPFGRSTVIRYALTQRSEVSLDVYDAAGRRVARLVTGTQDAGAHEAAFEPSHRDRAAAGVLFARLVARPDGGETETRNLKLVLAK